MTIPVADSTVVGPLSNADQIIGKIAELQMSLQRQLPNYESLLHTIHVALQRDPDVVQVLEDSHLGVIVAGLQKRTGIVIAEAAKKSAKNKRITVDDL